MQVGGVYRHENFYTDAATGQAKHKYLVLLARPAEDDLVIRLLTSRYANLRPPGCHHGTPYPGFALGVPGEGLDRPTWIDLRAQDDYDSDTFRGRLRRREIERVLILSTEVLRSAMACVAAADDTTRNQARRIQDELAALSP